MNVCFSPEQQTFLSDENKHPAYFQITCIQSRHSISDERNEVSFRADLASLFTARKFPVLLKKLPVPPRREYRDKSLKALAYWALKLLLVCPKWPNSLLISLLAGKIEFPNFDSRSDQVALSADIVRGETEVAAQA